MAEGLTKADFKVMEELGRGSYGVVYKVKYKGDELCYVLKTIALSLLSPKKQKEALQEVNILRKVDHPHIIRYYASFIEDNTLHILMEYIDGGDLQKVIRTQRERHRLLPEPKIWQFAYEIALAVQYLHSSHIVHRDIKPLNILLTKAGRVKVVDLGVATLMEGRDLGKQTRVGTPLFLAPEVVLQEGYDYKVDIWGFGCVLYTIAQQEHPFKGESLAVLGQNIVQETPKPLPRLYSQKLVELISLMMAKRPKDRPDISQVLDGIPVGVRQDYESPIRIQPPFRFKTHNLAAGMAEREELLVSPKIVGIAGEEVGKAGKPPLRKGTDGEFAIALQKVNAAWRRGSMAPSEVSRSVARQLSHPANLHVTCLPGDMSPVVKLPATRTDFPIVYSRGGQTPPLRRKMTIKDLTG